MNVSDTLGYEIRGPLMAIPDAQMTIPEVFSQMTEFDTNRSSGRLQHPGESKVERSFSAASRPVYLQRSIIAAEAISGKEVGLSLAEHDEHE